MSALAELRINDLRPRLSVKPNPPGYQTSRRRRVGPIDSATVHYNGPAISFRADIGRVLNFICTTDVANHQSRIGMDSLAYHFVIPDDGSIWQTRDLDLIAWHCAHPYGNEHSVAIHLPIGGDQQPTPAQLASLSALLDALGADYSFPRSAVRGHQEWHASACPGVPLMGWLRNWRQQPREGLTVQAEPRISADRFANVLASYTSPAVLAAAELYGICVTEGIDPAVALAFFVHESSAGTAGLTKAFDLKNWGNVRTPQDPTLGVVIQIPNRGGFVMYLGWQDGLLDWCKRMKGPKYAGAGLHTVEAITPKYAPGSDGNSPARYAEAVREMVARWAAADTVAPPKPVTRWRCVNAEGVNLRTMPNMKGQVVRVIPFGEVVDVDLVKTDGDAETIRGDNRWLHLASGEGFAWAGNFARE